MFSHFYAEQKDTNEATSVHVRQPQVFENQLRKLRVALAEKEVQEQLSEGKNNFVYYMQSNN